MIFDLVSGYDYPAEWIDKCDIKDLDLVKSGLAVLSSDGSIRRRGFTTGSTAAAAIKGAILSMHNEITSVEIPTNSSIRITIPVEVLKPGKVHTFKYSGDYPEDVTSQIEMIAEVLSDFPDKLLNNTEETTDFSIIFGNGIGRWNRDTPRFSKGCPAVSPDAYYQICAAMKEGFFECPDLSNCHILLKLPQGNVIAGKTLNHKVGVDGGISLLGTTGFVEPWDDHLEATAIDRAIKAEKVVLTTGRKGLRFSRLLFPNYETILVGSKLNKIIDHITGEIIICGLPALILKYLNPDFLSGSSYATVEEMTGTEEFFTRMNATLKDYHEIHPEIRVVILDRTGKILGETE